MRELKERKYQEKKRRVIIKVSSNEKI